MVIKSKLAFKSPVISLGKSSASQNLIDFDEIKRKVKEKMKEYNIVEEAKKRGSFAAQSPKQKEVEEEKETFASKASLASKVPRPTSTLQESELDELGIQMPVDKSCQNFSPSKKQH